MGTILKSHLTLMRFLSSSACSRRIRTPETRREFLKRSAAGLATTASLSTLPSWAPPTADPSGEIAVWTTSGNRRLERANSIRWQSANPPSAAEIIDLDPKQRFQDILGFGAAFTDASCFLFSKLPSETRQGLFHELFHASEMGLSVCRTCVGSSDYSTEVYSFDEGEPDPDLKRFSIDHDKRYILPILQQARAANPDLFLFSSPWSPPGWMKANGSMLGGSMQKKHFASYAQYFVKFLQAYAAEGVPIQAVTSQNEVDTDQDGRMPACLWGQEYEIDFVAKHLGPALEAAGLSTKIWLLDHNYNLWGRVICSLDDPRLRKHCGAVAWHGYVGNAEMIQKVYSAHPDVAMHWTEGGPDYTSPSYATDWVSWAKTVTDVLRNWCRSITGWNLALDERGRPNIGPFSCGGFITIHSETGEITRSGQYYAFAHFSRFLRRGARRFASTSASTALGHIACENPGGQKVLVVTNPDAARTAALRSGGMTAAVALDTGSITTLLWS
jgi:glucosylceramidase